MVKIYVAGSWKDRVRIRNCWIIPLQKLGHEITHDWTIMESSEKRDIQHQKLCAKKDLEGVVSADLLVVIMDNHISLDYHYRGTNFEMGAASALKIPIYLFNPWHNHNSNDLESFGTLGTNVFYFSEGITYFSNAHELLEKIKNFAS